mmetsp:Transcript_8947/g.21287  ORF Transcript_8947/g.21287 Transcript_8947/m.21287 type:complete len:205 (+) Transcript_8947:611-1225(+)
MPKAQIWWFVRYLQSPISASIVFSIQTNLTDFFISWQETLGSPHGIQAHFLAQTKFSADASLQSLDYLNPIVWLGSRLELFLGLVAQSQVIFSSQNILDFVGRQVLCGPNMSLYSSSNSTLLLLLLLLRQLFLESCNFGLTFRQQLRLNAGHCQLGASMIHVVSTLGLTGLTEIDIWAFLTLVEVPFWICNVTAGTSNTRVNGS